MKKYKLGNRKEKRDKKDKIRDTKKKRTVNETRQNLIYTDKKTDRQTDRQTDGRTDTNHSLIWEKILYDMINRIQSNSIK